MAKKMKIDKDWLYQKYIIENLNVVEISKIKNCNSSTIARRLFKFDIKKDKTIRNKYAITKEKLEKYYFEEKKSQKEIADILGADQTLISWYFKKLNIEARTWEENFGGNKHPRLGKENKWGNHTDAHKQHMSELMSGEGNPMFGKELSQETKDLLSQMFSGKGNPMYGKTGKDSPNYKNPEDRKNPVFQQIRTCLEYSKWRIQCFERDHYTCLDCGDNRGGNLVAHHILHFSKLLKWYNIETLEQSYECKELWNVNNGLTLCEDCHKRTHAGQKENYKK